jgi:ECF sigma factor
VNTKSPHDVTQLLLKWTQGDEAALEQLMPLVYEELRRMAQYLRKERAGHTMQTNTLLHEAYLRLIDVDRVAWQNRWCSRL